MKSKDKLFYILLVIVLLSVGFIITKKVFQNDTFYSIKIGQSIIKNGVDMKDHFSWIPNLSYTYPHWLYDVMIYGIYNISGFTGIYISTIILSWILLFTLYFTASKITGNKYMSFATVAIISLTISDYITPRAQLVSYILLLIVLYSVEMLRKKDNKKYYLYIFISSFLIANMHLAVWPFIFVLYLPYLVSDIVYSINNKFKLKIFDSFNIKIENSNYKLLLKIFIITLITGFLTPNFMVPFTYLIKTKMGISTQYISEHLPISIAIRPFLFILLFLIIILFLNKKSKIRLSSLFLIAGLFLMALLSRRNYSLFAILGLFPIVEMLNNTVNFNLKGLLNNKIFVTIISIYFICIVGVVYNNYKGKSFVDETSYPTKAAEFIKEKLDYKNIRLFNEYDYGSYLLFQDIPVFIDSRADLYLKEFNDCNAFEDFNNLFEQYKYIFSKYNITHVILASGHKLNSVLENISSYNIIYEDTYFKIYEILTD